MTTPKPVTEVRSFAALIPAGTPQNAPVTVSLAMPPREVLEITARIPPGPNGVMGFSLGSSGGSIIPDNSGAWIVTSDERIVWTLDNQITSGAWELRGYNTGAFDHTVYLRFVVRLPIRPALPDTTGHIIAAMSAPPVAAPSSVVNTNPVVIAGGA